METLSHARSVVFATVLFIGGCSAILPEGWERVDTSTLHRRYLSSESPGRTVPNRGKEGATFEDTGYAAKVRGTLFVNLTTAGY